MTPGEREFQHPRLLRPGLWEFTHNDDGHTEQIVLLEKKVDETEITYLKPVCDLPETYIEDLLEAGRFTKYLGPVPPQYLP